MYTEEPFYLLRGKSIHGLIQTQGLKLWWVAEQVGVHRTTLQRWITGRIDRVSRSKVERLATVLTTSPDGIVINSTCLDNIK